MESAPKQFRKRNAILQCLRCTDTHPSAEMVHEMLQSEHPDISLATVYRNLSLFKNQGIIASLGTVNGIERFDAITEPHVHFVCNTCTTVLDMPQMEVPETLSRIAADQSGCRIDQCRLTFSGTCQSCLSKNQAI